MKIIKCVKKPIEIECVQWNGKNYDEICEFTNNKCYTMDYNLYIQTLDGDMIAKEGSYIMKGIDGEFYACKKEIFEKTYDVLSVNENKIYGKLYKPKYEEIKDMFK